VPPGVWKGPDSITGGFFSRYPGTYCCTSASIARMDAMTASWSVPSGRPANTVLRIMIGGSAGFRMMIALDSSAPPISRSAVDVVLVNSSMFCRVPGPALLLETVETISA